MHATIFTTLTFLSIGVSVPTSVWADTGFEISVLADDGTPTTTHWAQSTASIGSSADCDIRLDGLRPEHVVFTREDDTVVMHPIGGPIGTAGDFISDPTELKPGARLPLGPYTVQLSFPVAKEEPPVEAQDLPDLTKAGRFASNGRKSEYSKQAYRFCHDTNFGEKGVVGTDLCVLFDDSSREVCPEVQKCIDWEDIDDPWTFDEAQNGKSSGRFSRELGRPEPLIDLSAIPPGVRIFALVVLFLAIAFVFALALRSAGWERRYDNVDDDSLAESAKNPQALPDAPSTSLLRRAREALEQRNDAREAAALAHIAILRHLDDEGIVRFHPSKTNGDYLRSLRRRKELAELFRTAMRQTERARFGDGRADPKTIERLLYDAEQVLPRSRARPNPSLPSSTMVGLLAIAILATACPPAPRTQAYFNHGPFGMSALPQLLRASGLPVETRRGPLTDFPEDVGLIVLRTSAVGKTAWPKEFELDQELDKGRTVFVVDDFGQSAEIFPGTASVSVAAGVDPRVVDLVLHTPPVAPDCARTLSALARPHGDPLARLPEGRLIVAGGELQTTKVSTSSLTMYPLLQTRGGLTHDPNAAHAWLLHREPEKTSKDGCLVVFSDRDLLTNASLTRADNADFVAQLFTAMLPEGRSILFADGVEQWTTGASDLPFLEEEKEPLRAIEASNLLPFAVQTLIFLAVLYIGLGTAFGPLRDPSQEQHQAFIEHVEAIGRQYTRLGPPGLTHSSTSLARFLVLRYRDRLRGGKGSGWNALAQDLASKHDLDVEHVRAALRLGIEGDSELGRRQPHDPLPSSTDMMRTLTRLLQIQDHRRVPMTARSSQKSK